jgi:hypothetical protein
MTGRLQGLLSDGYEDGYGSWLIRPGRQCYTKQRQGQ